MYKFIGLAKRYDSWTHEAFSAYYLNNHGPLVMSVPEVFGFFRKYTQNHPVVAPADGGWDAAGEIYFDSMEDVTKAFGAERYLGEIRPDEIYLSDLAAGRFIVTRETLMVDGNGARGDFKLFRFLARRGNIDRATFRNRWRKAAAELTAMPEFRKYCGRYMHNDLAFDGADHMNTGFESDFACDGCFTMWFRSAEDCRALLAGPWGRRLTELEADFVDAEATIQLLTREHSMFEPEGWQHRMQKVG